jgi:PAS domain S-box-containing protein
MIPHDDLLRENERLRAELEETREVLRAIRSGSVDALVVDGLNGQQVFTLEGADHPYRMFVETMNEGAITISAAGMVLYCNRVIADLIGLPLAQVLGTDFRQFILPADRPELESLIRHSDRESGRTEIAIEDATGNPIPVQLSVRRMPLKGEDVLCLVVTDMRSRKLQVALQESEGRLRSFAGQLEQLVAERTAELVQSQESLRALATELNLTEQRERKRMAIELHDHLQQMLVLAKLKLSQGKRMAETIPGYAGVVGQVEDILTDALTYTRTLVAELSPPVLREFGLQAGLKWLAEWMQQHGITVTVERAEWDDAALPEDQALLLFQSVRELLINSFKHAKTDRAAVRLEKHNGHLRIEVRDHGAGFNPAAASGGTASPKFGLFSIRERMRALGGAFDIQSSPGCGTTATLRLPLSNREEWRMAGDELDRSGERRPASGEPGVSSKQTDRAPLPTDHEPLQKDARIRVLLVDDHAMVRQGLRTVLENYADIEVIGEASNGEEAVALAEQLRPAVILMDINMPKMNGIEATATITSRYPGIVVIGLSVNAGSDSAEAMKKSGAVLLLTKEAAVDELYRAIQDVLSESEMNV